MKTRILITILMLAFAGQLSAETVFHYSSSPEGSFIGQNKTETLRPEDGWKFSVRRPYSRYLDTEIFITTGSRALTFFIVGPYRGLLKTGELYEASRFSNQAEAYGGFDFSMDGRGSNSSRSFFQVREVEYDKDNVPTKLAIDFIQCEANFDTKWTYGSLRFNSSVAVTVISEQTAALINKEGVQEFFQKKKQTTP